MPPASSDGSPGSFARSSRACDRFRHLAVGPSACFVALLLVALLCLGHRGGSRQESQERSGGAYPPSTSTAFDLVDKLFGFVDISASPRRQQRCCVASAPLRRRGSLRKILHCKWQTMRGKWATMIPRRDFRIRAPIAATIGRGTRIKRIDMDERQERLARERQEIAMRVANFKATQEKFKREREEYCVTTLQNARSGQSSWSQSLFRFDRIEAEF
jgi:chorismate mutase